MSTDALWVQKGVLYLLELKWRWWWIHQMVAVNRTQSSARAVYIHNHGAVSLGPSVWFWFAPLRTKDEGLWESSNTIRSYLVFSFAATAVQDPRIILKEAVPLTVEILCTCYIIDTYELSDFHGFPVFHNQSSWGRKVWDYLPPAVHALAWCF